MKICDEIPSRKAEMKRVDEFRLWVDSLLEQYYTWLIGI